MIFRVDKYSSTGLDMREEAEQFRRGLHAATLSDYLNDPDTGATTIGPVAAFATPFKTIADDLVANDTDADQERRQHKDAA